MAQVYLPRSLLALFPLAERRPVIDASSVDELIERLDARWPGIRARLCEAGPTLREHINVFVDGDRATLGTPLEPTSIVHVIPAVSGGAPAMHHRPRTELAGRQSRVGLYRPGTRRLLPLSGVAIPIAQAPGSY